MTLGCLALTILACAACKSSSASARSTVFTHDRPAFQLRVPGGYTPGSEAVDPLGRTGIDLRGPHARNMLRVEWDAATGTADEARDFTFDSARESGHAATGKGELPGGGAWVATQGSTDPCLDAYLIVGDTQVKCEACGDAAVLEACKSLAPR